MPIYTKTGDKGETSLFGGKRIAKSHDSIAVSGAIDEVNSWIGLLAAEFDNYDVRQFLEFIQNDLFLMGSVVSGWHGSLLELADRIKAMEDRMDAMEKELTKLSRFILPGGTSLSASIHIARSVVRRAERQCVLRFVTHNNEVMYAHLPKKEKEIIFQYMNRLSDFLFVLARFVNKKANVSDVEWKR